MIRKKHYLYIFLFIIILYLIYIFGVVKPSNDRDWEVGFEKLPKIKIDNTLVTITDVRDYQYAPGKFISARYINRTVDISQLERAWFVVEPFDGIPLIQFNGVAHTYFVFDFADEKPVVVSVEARREKGERFGLLSGMMNKFELMYVWGTEEDLTSRRVLIEENKLYMYPLTISKESAQRLFLQVAKTSQELESQPRFYHSLTSNCTNELAKNANKSKPGTIPYNLVWFLPGYASEELYKLGFIPNDQPLEEISQKYYISDLVREHYNKPDFSERIRERLL